MKTVRIGRPGSNSRKQNQAGQCDCPVRNVRWEIPTRLYNDRTADGPLVHADSVEEVDGLHNIFPTGGPYPGNSIDA